MLQQIRGLIPRNIRLGQIQPQQIGCLRHPQLHPRQRIRQLRHQKIPIRLQILQFRIQELPARPVCGLRSHQPQNRRPILRCVRQSLPHPLIVRVAENNLRALESRSIPCLRRCCCRDTHPGRGLAHPGRHHMLPAVIHQRGMNLIHQHPRPKLCRQIGDPHQLLPAKHKSQRIIRVTQQQTPGTLLERFPQLPQIKRLNKNPLPAGGLQQLEKRGIGRHRHNYL